MSDATVPTTGDMRRVPQGQPFARGRAADVYAIDADTVLRRYRHVTDTLREAAVMHHVSACGVAVPRVVEACGGDLVMERVSGPTMLAALPRRPWRYARLARDLAELHRAVGRVPAPTWLPAVPGIDPSRATVVAHLDLHPDNVLLSRAGPVIIDWTNARAAPPGTDVAATWLLLAVADAPGGSVTKAAVTVMRRAFLRAFLRHVDVDTARSSLPLVAGLRLDDPNMSATERDAIRRLVEAEGTDRRRSP